MKYIFIKIGGSIITDKTEAYFLREQNLDALIEEIGQIYHDLPVDTRIILGHGHGSFAHVPAKRYQTKKGNIDQESFFGLCAVYNAVNKLHTLIIDKFIQKEIPALSFRLNQTLITSEKKKKDFFTPILDKIFNYNSIPMVCGDVIFDNEIDWTVFSTEEIFGFLIDEIIKQNHQITKIIHISDVSGFLDKNRKTVKAINPENWPSYEKDLYQHNSFDTTGGMEIKVKTSLELAQKHQIKTMIINGDQPENLREAVFTDQCTGTIITID